MEKYRIADCAEGGGEAQKSKDRNCFQLDPDPGMKV